ncbi:uncharacterized protein LY89DRAFT_263277 [Mollisia scopiformis]|uniref:2EXR domain-containing protein n=1 Tax=Mollisia scopiformis TaxID=149040 RepID=A0A132BDM6_MOLSC|nr:uncharacterized protein LY89DRAFT_263277 [Mollisia scopiformis]KUJ10516.1 hypothetical protein LY89DRAFT_263277 [Mollisia scopiformis]
MQLRNRLVGAGQAFHQFKRLPTEIRCMIWKFSLQPRVVEIATDIQVVEDTPYPGDVYEGTYYYSKARLPAILDVCHESRSATLPLYPLCFRYSGPGIRFNVSFDILYINHDVEDIRNLLDFLKNTSKRKSD